MAKSASTPQVDMERTWNVGVGMVAIVDPSIGDLAIKSLAARGMKAWVAGRIERHVGPGASSLEGQYKTR